MSQTSRSSGELTESSGTSGSVAVATGPVKLNSVHGYVVSGTSTQCTIYDNTAASGTIVARMLIDSSDIDGAGPIGAITGKSMEFDMHGVYCKKGIFAVITTPTGSGNHGFTIEYE